MSCFVPDGSRFHPRRQPIQIRQIRASVLHKTGDNFLKHQHFYCRHLLTTFRIGRLGNQPNFPYPNKSVKFRVRQMRLVRLFRR